MKITLLKMRNTAVAALLICAVALCAVYVLALAVAPVRTGLHQIAKGTVFEFLLPQDSGGNEQEGSESAAQDMPVQGQAVEISFSPAAAKNIGIDDSSIVTIKAADFRKSLTFPAVVVERPGFSTITVPSPVSGVVSKIYCESGVSVAPGEPLFDILLNQQELVKAQSEFLTLLKEREINAAEIQRLSGLDQQIVPKQRRELEYEKSQIDSKIEIQKNLLLLQGLKTEDVTGSLEQNGRIIHTMTVYAPSNLKEEGTVPVLQEGGEERFFTIEELGVTTGKTINIGDSLCQLSDYRRLTIKGKAFAVNEKMLTNAVTLKSRVAAAFESSDSREIVDGLFLRSVDNKIDSDNGTLFCYADLKNHCKNYETDGSSDKRRYTQWHFKPGQRCELNVEFESLPNCIVLPVDAVAKNLQETSVFEWVGNEDDKKIWRKKPVHVIHQTKDSVVIANDGSVFPGAKVAVKGASFILAALDASNQKNAGGGIQHGDHVH